MAKTEPFEHHSARYESWFEDHGAAFESELAAVRELWPQKGESLEIGVGAGHFAAPLGITLGVEPSSAMRRRAVSRGVRTLNGTAEHLPFPDERFDATLMVTTICFVDDPAQSVREMFRVLRPGGCAVLGFVDRESSLGREYERKRKSSVFYGDAQFFSVSDVSALLRNAGFTGLEYRQTLDTHPNQMSAPVQARPGSGQGSFVVVRGHKPGNRRC